MLISQRDAPQRKEQVSACRDNVGDGIETWAVGGGTMMMYRREDVEVVLTVPCGSLWMENENLSV